MARNTIKREPRTGIESDKIWAKRIEDALTYNRKHPFGWEAKNRFYDLYRGNHFRRFYGDPADALMALSTENPRRHITVNITGADILDIHSALVRRFQKLIIKPKRKEFVRNAPVVEGILNWAWKEFDVSRQIAKCGLSMLIGGRGVAETGYIVEKAPFEMSRKDGRIFYEDYVRADNPFVKYVSDFLFLHDLNAPGHDLETSRWCAKLFYRPVGDVVVDPTYEEEVREKIRKGVYKPRSLNVFELSQSDKKESATIPELEEYNSDCIMMAEIWDKKFFTYRVLALDVDPALVKPKEWPYDYLENEGFPFESVGYIPNLNEPFPIAFPAWIENQQHELNLERTAGFRYRRRHTAAGVEYDPNAVDGRDLDKWLEGEDAAIKSKRPGSIVAVKQPELNPQMWLIENQLKGDIREITGRDALARGENLPARTTAYEVAERTKRYGQKIGARADDFDLFVMRVARRFLQHIQANFDVSRSVRVLGEAGYEWRDFSNDDIQGEYDIELKITNELMFDPIVDRKQRIELFREMHNPVVQQGLASDGMRLSTTKMAEWVFDGFEIKEYTEFIVPAQPQNALAAPQQQLALPSPQGLSEPPGSIQETEQERQMQELMKDLNLMPEIMGDVEGGLT